MTRTKHKKALQVLEKSLKTPPEKRKKHRKTIILLAPMVLAKDLDFETARRLLKRANSSAAREFIDFSICGSTSEGWMLYGHSKSVMRAFAENPRKFYLAAYI